MGYVKMVSIDDFVKDASSECLIERPPPSPAEFEDLIDGVSISALTGGSDARGNLLELLTTRDARIEPIVHVYQVIAAPKSVRAWVLHRQQEDRLAFTNGTLRVVLYDVRPGSRTHGKLDILDVGTARPCLLTIPRFVVHGVQNRGDAPAIFTNLPTRPYFAGDPDKWRLPAGHPGIPYRF